MKKILLIFIFFIIFIMPILASPNEDKNLNSEIGRVEKIEYEDLAAIAKEKESNIYSVRNDILKKKKSC